MMYDQKSLKNRKLTRARLINYVRRNPGLTASQFGRLLGKPYGSISARLYELCEEGALARYESHGAIAGKAWRYKRGVMATGTVL
jgi:hypothetical protein